MKKIKAVMNLVFFKKVNRSIFYQGLHLHPSLVGESFEICCCHFKQLPFWQLTSQFGSSSSEICLFDKKPRALGFSATKQSCHWLLTTSVVQAVA